MEKTFEIHRSDALKNALAKLNEYYACKHPVEEAKEFSINRIYASWCFCDIKFVVGGRHDCGNICISHRDDNEHLTQDIDLTEEEFNRLEKFVLIMRKQLNTKKADKMSLVESLSHLNTLIKEKYLTVDDICSIDELINSMADNLGTCQIISNIGSWALLRKLTKEALHLAKTPGQAGLNQKVSEVVGCWRANWESDTN